MPIFNKDGYITSLGENEVFVFGSNWKGNHVGGAALTALNHFGAIEGQSEGLQGQSYGINTMDGLDILQEQAARFKAFARLNPDIKFYLTAIGQGIAGYEKQDIEPIFNNLPPNVKKVGW